MTQHTVDSLTPYPEGPALRDRLSDKEDWRAVALLSRATLGAILFFAMYAFAIVSLLWLSWESFAGTSGGGFTYLAGHFLALFCAAYLVKNLFFSESEGASSPLSVEVSRDQQPLLFGFLRKLCDELGVDMPIRVYLSAEPRVGIHAEFSVISLFRPVRQELLIGLCAVNSLDLNEFKAICAHELARYGRLRGDRVFRWTAKALVIARILTVRTDAVDRWLRDLQRNTQLAAPAAYVAGAITLLLRSLIELSYYLCVSLAPNFPAYLAFRADRRASSTAGSAALLYATLRLQEADELWAIANEMNAFGVRDACQLQDNIRSRWREMLQVAPTGAVPAGASTVFSRENAAPPRMWASYPSCVDREAQARCYWVACPSDARPAWVVLDDAKVWREKVTPLRLHTRSSDTRGRDETVGATLAAHFSQEICRSEYRGLYFGRHPFAAVDHWEDLYAAIDATDINLARVYPEQIVGLIHQLAAVKREHTYMIACRDTYGIPSWKSTVYRGRVRFPVAVSRAISALGSEIARLEKELAASDRCCRTTHRAIARVVGQGWESYHCGLTAVLHYVERSCQRLDEAYSACHAQIMVSATHPSVSKGAARRAKRLAQSLCRELDLVAREREAVRLDSTLLSVLGVSSWSERCGFSPLPDPESSRLSDWLEDASPRVGHIRGALSELRDAALDELLRVEAALRRYWRQQERMGLAPEASSAPSMRSAAPRPTFANVVSQWLNSHPHVPVGLRWGGVVVVAILGAIPFIGQVSVAVFNGLGETVEVEIDAQRVRIAPDGVSLMELAPFGTQTVRVHTVRGQEVETFEVNPAGSRHRHFYNIAAALPLRTEFVTYGYKARDSMPNDLGMVRWGTTDAVDVFSASPHSIPAKSVAVAGYQRKVLRPVGLTLPPATQLSMIESRDEQLRVIRLHAEFDASSYRDVAQWLVLASSFDDFPALLARRQRVSPDDLAAGVFEQNLAMQIGRGRAVCDRFSEEALRHKANPSFLYLAARCQPSPYERDEAYLAAADLIPGDGALAYQAGEALVKRQAWTRALDKLKIATRTSNFHVHAARKSLVRLERFVNGKSYSFSSFSDDYEVSLLLSIERENRTPTFFEPYAWLKNGDVNFAATAADTVSEPDRRKVLALCAASRGAGSVLVRRVLTDTTASKSDTEALFRWALSRRERGDVQATYADLIEFDHAFATRMSQFALLVEANRFVDAEGVLVGMDLYQLGKAYAVGAVLAPGRAPQDWVSKAQRLLFVTERPYL